MTSRRQALPGAVFVFALNLTLVLAGPPAARAIDTVGLWFDEAYTQNDINGTVYPHFGTAYLVLHEPGLDSVGGWECKITTEGPVTVLGWNLVGQAFNFTEPPEFVVGLGSPLPMGLDVLLATVPFMIEAAAPVTFSLGPVYHDSIPGEMAYISFTDPNILVPMTTATGVPEVAWFNRELPVCVLSAEVFDYGPRPLGITTVRYLTIRNEGGGTLWVDPQLTGGDGDFAILAGGGPGGVQAGQQRVLTLGFTPTSLGPHEAQLAISGDCPAVALIGSGREPVASGHVIPNPVDFGEIPATTSAQRTATVVNGGEVPLAIDVVPGDGCAAFAIGNQAAFTLAPGTQAPLPITFAPPAAGTYACTVTLNPAIAPLQLAGAARDPLSLWSVSPTAVDFGTVGLDGATVTRLVTVRNLGELAAALDLGLDDPTGFFSLIAPTDPQPVLAPGASLPVLVGFAPTVAGTHAATLRLGGGAPDVPLTGIGSEPEPGCLVGTQYVDFVQVPLGDQATRSVRVTNTGNTVLGFDPTCSCPEFTVTSFPSTIAPGSYGWFTVAYRPGDPGIDECLLDLGPDACSPVTLRGEGVPSSWSADSNLVAVSFDPDVLQPETSAYLVPVQAWLLLVNPASHEGVWAWELKLGLDPEVLLLASDLGFQALNFATPPEYIVGLGTPIPDAPIMVLAELTLFPVDPDAHPISVGPTHIPSIPGQMAWGINAQVELAPMFPIGGDPVVAWINASDTGVAVLAPTPAAALVGGRVELRWRLAGGAAGDADGCHVDRTFDGETTRLTALPLPPAGDGFLFVDDPAGLPAGAALAYSYAVVRGGVEIARSPAVTVELPGAGALATRLLPNRPNPFNPETEVRFALARAGRVRLEVFDAGGRRVAVLADDARAAGEHQVVWRGRDQGGRPVPSGPYYVRLEADGGRDTRKIMLLK
ncbi:MAG: choice-of-anchor D domain-containing protein [Candidatus Krumholzibacteriia bacterium]